MNTPVGKELVDKEIQNCGIVDFGKASIREIVKLVGELENKSGVKFIRMEMGVPGLKATEVGVNAEIEALKKGVASIYPPIDGTKEFKEESSKFIKNFVDVNISPKSCIPTVGSMQGTYATLMVSCRRETNRRKLLFLDPGFPVQKTQMKVIGLEYESFDVYDYRGDKLKEKLESILAKGEVSTILYSNPNNPAWICFTDEELQIIGNLANKYDVVIIEDLAYFAMDFRHDFSKPGEPPYQPSIAKYTDNYVLLISASKIFSYAGQRISILAVSDKLNEKSFQGLKSNFSSSIFGHAIVYEALYALSAGTSHSAQVALTEILRKANLGEINITESVKEYGERAEIMKKYFIQNGFNIVYDMDVDKPIADGFYFTISYPGFEGVDLAKELLAYGISSIPLNTTGSKRTEGLRACVSFVLKNQLNDLEKRLQIFNENHS